MSTSPAPQHCPTPRELDDLELLVSGALEPTRAFNEPGSPVTLTLPSALAHAETVELVDPEGLPLAVISTGSTGGWTIEPLTHAQFGPFRDLYLTPAQVREQYAGRTFVPVADPLTDQQLEQIGEASTPVVLVALVGTGTPSLSPVGLIRATLAAAHRLDAAVVAVPLASHGDPDADHELGVRVVGNYADPDPVLALPGSPGLETVAGATSSTTERSSVVEEGEERARLETTYPDEIADIVDFERPPVDDQGLVLFFTGLSGSGKSTLARALMDRILEQGRRTVTSLDGDVVRRNLSAGLTFSREDRETNIRRIGWVAAEIARHGGVAVCSPIAPFDETRQQVRSMVEEAGGAFFLVHVATPLEECERRDRKGLYAKARRGEIPEFTGISSPYEEPEDAAVRVDTTGRTIEDALDDVLVALREEGFLDLQAADPSPGFEAQAPGRLHTSSSEPTSGNDAPLRVLFVCTANICRSAFMEVVARHLAGKDAAIEFSSAGTHGLDREPMNEDMVVTLDGRDVEHAEFRSRPLTGDLIADADLVLTAESTHRTFILDDHPAEFRKVFTLGQFAAAVQADDSGATGRDLLERIGERRGTADPALDIPDPYRRGPEASTRAATTIEYLLQIVLPALTGESTMVAP